MDSMRDCVYSMIIFAAMVALLIAAWLVGPV